VKLVVESARERRWAKELLAVGTLSDMGPEKISSLAMPTLLRKLTLLL
jgi:hypothetical protein